MRTLRPIARTEMRSTPPVLTGLVPARAGSSSLASGFGRAELGACVWLVGYGCPGIGVSGRPASCSLVGSEELWEVPCVAFKASMRRAASAASMRPAARSSRMGVMSGVVIRPNVNRIFREREGSLSILRDWLGLIPDGDGLQEHVLANKNLRAAYN